jgi:hypothetical protein
MRPARSASSAAPGDYRKTEKTAMTTSADIMKAWPEESREAASLVVKAYGEPHEATASELIWHDVGPWKRIVAQRAFWKHDFPAPHTDSVESFIDYRVPVAQYSDLARFDGSVMVERTSGELSARCHDEQANLLALNLTHDIVTGSRTVEDARAYYAKEFLDARRKRPTPYMERLRFELDGKAAADPDVRVLSDADLNAAEAEGEGVQAQTAKA